uniref:Uncharacterized protein n=1 Tax=Arundo donax TaxID=35708 RepID=A0A0A8Z0U6_ARUDO
MIKGFHVHNAEKDGASIQIIGIQISRYSLLLICYVTGMSLRKDQKAFQVHCINQLWIASITS